MFVQIAAGDLHPESVKEHVARMTEEWNTLTMIMEKSQLDTQGEIIIIASIIDIRQLAASTTQPPTSLTTTTNFYLNLLYDCM